MPVPLIQLPEAERETGGIAVEVLGAGEITERQPQALEPADALDLGSIVAGRESPSMVAFRFKPVAGARPARFPFASSATHAGRPGGQRR